MAFRATNLIFLGLLSLLLALVTRTVAQVDLTVQEEAKGVDVVEQVIRKISRSAIFADDKSFLKRIAYVESKFGEASDTFPGNYHGGIWQLDQAQYDETKNSTTLGNFHNDIARYITPSIIWTTTTWQDLRKPLHSGLAARLYLQAKLGDTVAIPGLLSRQADFWSTNINNNGDWTAQYFISEVGRFEEVPICDGLFDLAIVMDGSGSIGASDFELAKNFTANLVGTFSRTTTRIGFLVYATDTEIIFDLTNTYNTTEMQAAIMSANYPAQNTFTGTAMVRAIEILRPVGTSRPGVPKLMAVFTDGQSNGGIDVSVAAQQVAEANITSFAIGIGTGIIANELLIIANRDRDNMFLTDSYEELSEFFLRFNERTCEEPQRPEFDEVIQDSLRQNEKRYFNFNAAVEGMTIKLSSLTGVTRGYYSYTESNPSSAFYDGIFEGDTFIPFPTNADGTTAPINIAIQGIGTANSYSLEAMIGDKADTETTTTEAPTTEEPATEPPTTEQPATEPPTTEQPATEPPTTERPPESTTAGSMSRVTSGVHVGLTSLIILIARQIIV